MLRILIIYIAIFLRISCLASDNDTLFLSGTVSEATSLTIISQTSATNLDIIHGEAGTSVGTAIERTNATIGYLVLMHSTNGGKLVNNSNSSASTSYQIKYGTGEFKSPGTPGSPALVAAAFNFGAQTVREKEIRINVNALPSATTGNYSDTVTFTIQAY